MNFIFLIIYVSCGSIFQNGALKTLTRRLKPKFQTEKALYSFTSINDDLEICKEQVNHAFHYLTYGKLFNNEVIIMRIRIYEKNSNIPNFTSVLSVNMLYQKLIECKNLHLQNSKDKKLIFENQFVEIIFEKMILTKKICEEIVEDEYNFFKKYIDNEENSKTMDIKDKKNVCRTFAFIIDGNINQKNAKKLYDLLITFETTECLQIGKKFFGILLFTNIRMENINELSDKSFSKYKKKDNVLSVGNDPEFFISLITKKSCFLVKKIKTRSFSNDFYELTNARINI
ncbi:hypothetical protein GVAV_001648 [Gurleya vavrai]